MTKRVITGVVLLWGMLSGLVQGQEIPLTRDSVVRFATVARAREILTNRDDFIRALSPFDRSARMQVADDPGEDAFLQFLGANAMAWEPSETNQLAEGIAALSQQLQGLELALPKVVEIVKSTGKEEAGAAYTRANAIVFPREKVSQAAGDLLAHELFHVLSRNSPETRARLYRLIGFRQIGWLPLPPDLAARKLTNPDGVQEVMIRVRRQDVEVRGVPVLYASINRYDPAEGESFFRYLTFKLMVVDQVGDQYAARTRDGKADLLELSDVTGFYEQIGRNTGYIIHPDEILAENFVLLLQGKTNVPSPQIISGMKRILTTPLTAPR